MTEKSPVINRIEDGSFERPYVISRLSREQALDYPDCPKGILELQAVESVKYLFEDNFYEGQIVICKELAQDVTDLFDFILTLPEEHRFPIESVKPIILYNNDDELSMQANNSSGFNYRNVEGQDILSKHAFGLAIDLNPRQNPVMVDGKITQPQNGTYDPEQPGTLYAGHPIVEFLKARGWIWLGDREHNPDYQHFYKEVDEEI